MVSLLRSSGIAGLVVIMRAASGALTEVPVPLSSAKPWLVSGAGNGRRRATSLPKGRAAKGRFPGAAGKLRP